MDSMTIHFEVENGFDAEVLAPRVAERLNRIEGVESAEADVEDERIVVGEVVAVIAGVVLLTKATREGVEELKKLIASLRGVVQEVNGLRGAVLDYRGRKVALDDPEKAIAALQTAG